MAKVAGHTISEHTSVYFVTRTLLTDNSVASVAFDSTDNLASLTVAMVNSPTEVFSRITLEWGSVNSSSQSTPISNEASGGPSGRRKAKRSGFDKETTISIDTSTWIDTISQFLWGYNLGRSITDPAALSDIKGYDEINPYMLSNDPKNYYNESTQYGSSFHFDNQLVSVS